MTVLQWIPGKLTEQQRRRILIGVIGIGVAVSAALLFTQQILIASLAVMLITATAAVVLFPDVATYLVAFVIYSNTAVVAVRFHGAPWVLGAAVPGLLAVPLLYHLVRRREEIVITPVTLLALTFLLIELIGALFSADASIAFTNVTVFVSEGLLIFLLITNVVRAPQTLRGVLWALLLAGLVLAVFPIIQYATETYDSDYWGMAQAEGRGVTTGEDLFGDVRQPRVAGALGEKNFFAQIMLMVVPIGITQASAEKKTWLRLAALIIAGLCAVAVGLTFSRGAAVGFAVMLVVAGTMRALSWRQIGIMVLLAALLAVLFPTYAARVGSVFGVATYVQEDTEVEVDGAIEGRATEMLAAALVFADHPFTGVGPGMYKYYSTEYGNQLGLKTLAGTRRAHSLYLELAAEGGIPGLLVFLAMVTLTVLGLARAKTQYEPTNPAFAHMSSGIMLALITYLTTGLFLHMSYERYFWLVLAVGAAAVNIARTLPDAPTVTNPLSDEGMPA